jgi:hypothetical protein
MATAKRAAVVVEQVADGADRRASQRLVVDWEVDYQSEDNYLFASIVDISSTGIFVKTLTPHAAGTQLNLRFVPTPSTEMRNVQRALANEANDRTIGNHNRLSQRQMALDVSPIEVLGEVAWTNQFNPQSLNSLQPGMGIRFVELADDTKTRLLELIRRIAYLPEFDSPDAD